MLRELTEYRRELDNTGWNWYFRPRTLPNNVIGASNPDYHNIHNSNKWWKWRCRGFADYPAAALSRIHVVRGLARTADRTPIPAYEKKQRCHFQRGGQRKAIGKIYCTWHVLTYVAARAARWLFTRATRKLMRFTLITRCEINVGRFMRASQEEGKLFLARKKSLSESFPNNRSLLKSLVNATRSFP